MDPQLTPFPRRRAPGKWGGKPVKREFHFAPRDGIKYPSESVAIRENRVPESPNKMRSWSWALNFAGANDCWLVVPVNGKDESERREDVAIIRASLWRTGGRHGFSLTSEYVFPNLYVRVVQ